MADRDRTIAVNFLTTAQLDGAVKTEKAIDGIGAATDRAGDKLEEFERDFREKMKGIQDKVDEARRKLEEGGNEGGANFMSNLSLQLNANADLVNKAWGIGSQIGTVLGEGLTMAWEGTLTEKLDDILAPWSERASRNMAARLNAEVAEKMKDVYSNIKTEQDKFWQDYMNATPANATQWLDDLTRKLGIATQALQALNRVRGAEADARLDEIDADTARQNKDIDQGPGTDDEKARAKNKVAIEKEQKLLEERNRHRAEQNEVEQAEAALKKQQAESMRKMQEDQEKRAAAQQRAENEIDERIGARKAEGGDITDKVKADIRAAAYANEEKKSGIDLDQNKDEKAELARLKEQRKKADDEARAAAADAETKRQENEIRGQTDKNKTERRIEDMRMPAPAEDPRRTGGDYVNDLTRDPKNPSTQRGEADDIRDQLGKIGANTGDSSLKMAVEDLKRRLADGSTAAELKEAAALMERAQSDNNDAVRRAADVMRSAVEASKARMTALEQSIAALQTTVDNIRTR
ncbi:MAG: hypothetical protein V4662_17635 [Verrucomicrobiota bacterium]